MNQKRTNTPSTEPDYLASAQAKSQQSLFERAVMESFAVEHGCKTQADIARVIDRNFTRVSQILGSPEKLKAESIQLLLDHIQTPEFKQHIVSSWIKHNFGDVLRGRPSMKEAKTLKGDALWKHFQKLELEDRHLEGARLAERVAETEEDDTQYAELVRHACKFYSLIGLPGQAMRLVGQMARRAVDAGDPYLYFLAFEERIRLHIEFRLKTPQEAIAVANLMNQYKAEIEQFSIGAPKHSAPRHAPNPNTLTNLSVYMFLQCLRSGIDFGANADMQEELLRRFQRSAGKKSLSRDLRSVAYLTIAEIQVFRKNKVEAEEALEAALSMLGGNKTYNFESAKFAATYGLIKKAVGEPEEAAAYLRDASERCRIASALELQRDVELAILELESKMFPPSHPVL